MVFIQLVKALRIYFDRRNEQIAIMMSMNDRFPVFSRLGIQSVEDCDYLSIEEGKKHKFLTDKINELDKDFDYATSSIKSNIFGVLGWKSSNRLKDFINKWRDPGPGWRQG